MMALASTTNKELMFIQLLVARVLIGLCIGLSSSPTAVYSSEIAHPTLRGRISVLTSLTIGIGILLIYVLGYLIQVSSCSSEPIKSTQTLTLFSNFLFVFRRQTNWRLVSAISCSICIIALILLIPIPETPTWLASKGRPEKAEKSLRIFKGLPKKGKTVKQQ